MFMRKRILTGLSVLAVAVALVFVIRRINPVEASFTIPDPCNTQQRLSAPVNVATATTTNVVTAVAGEGIYVCGQYMNVSTASATVKWEYGTTTSTACDTGATAITGVMATPASTPASPYFVQTSNFTLFSVPAGNQLCIVTTGTTPGVQGYVTFVQG
jgi:hypothetical protein